jgi:hypothetical protein
MTMTPISFQRSLSDALERWANEGGAPASQTKPLLSDSELEVDFDEPANAMWMSEVAGQEESRWGGPTKRFGSLREAIVFVMEELDQRDRETARISIRRGALRIDDIRRIYNGAAQND